MCASTTRLSTTWTWSWSRRRSPLTIPGTVEEIVQPNGGRLRLRKLAPDYDPHDWIAAMKYLQERQAAGEIVTGLLYVEAEPTDLHDYLNTVGEPLNQLADADLCPGAEALTRFNESLR